MLMQLCFSIFLRFDVRLRTEKTSMNIGHPVYSVWLERVLMYRYFNTKPFSSSFLTCLFIGFTTRTLNSRLSQRTELLHYCVVREKKWRDFSRFILLKKPSYLLKSINLCALTIYPLVCIFPEQKSLENGSEKAQAQDVLHTSGKDKAHDRQCEK